LAELLTLWTAVETAFVELWPALETALEMLFPAVPAAEHASSATDRALELEIDLAASLHLDTALLELELELLPHPAATRPQTTSSKTDPLTRPIQTPQFVVGASLHAGVSADPVVGRSGVCG